MFFKDFVSVKKEKNKKGASQTYDTPSFCMPFIPTFFPKTLEVTREKRIFAEEKLHSAN